MTSEVAPPIAIAGGLAEAESTSHGSASTVPRPAVCMTVEQAFEPSAVGPSLQPHQLPVASIVERRARVRVADQPPPTPLPTIRDRVTETLVVAVETLMPPAR